MGHHIQALISEISILQDFAAKYKNAVVVDLEVQSMGLLPLSFALVEEINPDDDVLAFRDFLKLTKSVIDVIAPISDKGAIAYIQTEYFGGIGEQGAIVWYMGEIVYPPTIVSGIGAINMALEKLGVERNGKMDEFLTLGLWKFRNMGKWETEDEL